MNDIVVTFDRVFNDRVFATLLPRLRFCSLIIGLGLVSGVGGPAFAASFRGLGDLPGGDFYSATSGVSADGSAVAGTSKSINGSEAFRWTAREGMVGLGDLPGGPVFSRAYGISGNGKVVVGESKVESASVAFRWTQAAGMISLGDLPGGNLSSVAWGVNGDGTVIVGESSSSKGSREAFRWTTAQGMSGLGDLPGGNFVSSGFAVSANGSTVIGFSHTSNGDELGYNPFRWTESTGMVALGDLPNGIFNSNGYDVSGDGSVVVGYGCSGAFDIYTHEAFRWTQSGGMVPLGFAPGDDWSVAWAVSGDGNTVVGDNGVRDAIIWREGTGVRHLTTVLTQDYGLDVTGWELTSARAVSWDGTVIVGYGNNPDGNIEGWVATLRPPSLEIERNENGIALSWDTTHRGFVLEETASPTLVNSWCEVSDPLFREGDFATLAFFPTEGCRYFRLRKP